MSRKLAKDYLRENVMKIVEATNLKGEHLRYMGMDNMKKVLVGQGGFATPTLDLLCEIFNLKPSELLGDLVITDDLIDYVNNHVVPYARECYLKRRTKYYSYSKKKGKE